MFIIVSYHGHAIKKQSELLPLPNCLGSHQEHTHTDTRTHTNTNKCLWGLWLMILIHKIEWDPIIITKVDGSGGYYVTRNKSDAESDATFWLLFGH
jgi:hypothetical protein